MKKKVMLCGVVLILGLLVLGCGGDDGSVIPGPPASSPYAGTTWKAVNGARLTTLTFTNTEYEITMNDSIMGEKGTYTYSGNSISFRKTHESFDYGVTWIEDPSDPRDATVSGITLTRRGSSSELFIKQDVYTETTWIGTDPQEGNATLTFINNTFQIKYASELARKGTYTVSNDGIKITFNFTHTSQNNGETWTSFTSTQYGEISGNTMNIPVVNGPQGIPFTKQ